MSHTNKTIILGPKQLKPLGLKAIITLIRERLCHEVVRVWQMEYVLKSKPARIKTDFHIPPPQPLNRLNTIHANYNLDLFSYL